MPFVTNLLRSGTALAALALATQPAQAQATDDVGVEILQLLVDEGVIPLEKAQQLLDRAKKAAELRAQREAPKAASTIDVPYVPEAVRNQIRDQVKAEVIADAQSKRWIAPNKLPAWLDRITLSGDFRLRYQANLFADTNFPQFPDVNAIVQAGGSPRNNFPLLNSTIDRYMLRYRARLGVEAKITDQVKVGFRLASGDNAGPVSTNETLGDFFQKDGIYIDRAYVELSPFEQVTLTGGRMPNPFYSTDLVWDTDINPEGVAASLSYQFGEDALNTRLFATGGWFPLQERELDPYDRNLIAGQAGFEFEPAAKLKIKAAGAYYHFRNVQGIRNAPDGSRLNDFTAPLFLSQGNSLFDLRTDGVTSLPGLASKFELVTGTGSISYAGFGDIGVKLTGEYVRNIGFDRAEIAARRVGEPASVPPENYGYQIRLDVGHDKIAKLGDWQLGVGYKRVGTDAVLDVFTDSDFGLGGTDVKGYLIEAQLGVFANTAVGLNWYSTKSINRAPFDVDVLQINLTSGF
ncbi:putative porin [Sphingomonas koreensis]